MLEGRLLERVGFLCRMTNLGMIASRSLVRCQRATAVVRLLDSISEYSGSLFLPLGRNFRSYIINCVPRENW